MESNIIIGIDLGTTNSCAAYFINGSLKIPENREGHRTTPSYVYYQDQKSAIVGVFAKKIATNRPECGVSEIKRFIGRQYNEVEGVCTSGRLPFHVRNADGKPVVALTTENTSFQRTPEQVTAAILQKIKADVCVKLREPIDKAVITVPAHFNVSQRKATLEAATQAGFNVMKLLNEPTAAALSYYYDTTTIEKTHTLVYDLGGGTFDVAILEKIGPEINILSVDGDSLLGGQDFDNLLFNHLCDVLRSEYGYDPSGDKRAVRRLKTESMSCKEELSVTEQTTIYLEGLVDDFVAISVSRTHFELMAHKLFQRSIDIVDRCIRNSNLTRQDIDEVILAGGSTRIPKIQALLSEHFDGKILDQTIHPDECVATGAALQAAMLSEDPRQVVKRFTLTEVTAASLGVGDFANEMNFVIRKNTPLPVRRNIVYTTVRHHQQFLSVEIFEGERTDARKNVSLGQFKIRNLTLAPPKKCKVDIVMEIDLNGILTVTANEILTDNSKQLEIAYTSLIKDCAFAADEIDNEDEDERFSKFAAKKRSVINFCIKMRYNFKQRELIRENRIVYDKCKAVELLVKNMDTMQEHEVVKFHAEILKECEPLIKKYNFEV